MEFPNELKYSESDEWVRVEADRATLGVTDFAQDQLSDVVYFELVVEVGDKLSKGDAVGILESVKAAADINSPVSGEVTEINAALPDNPELVNSDPYGEAWMVRIQMSDPAELEQMMDTAAYQQNTEERSGA
ncbi:MAG: glycine cleavage system protein GcvH [Anaerolineae bacterium]|nr:MAG: glycine cleavage system protein GcvH [Anaerolineae bacterium]